VPRGYEAALYPFQSSAPSCRLVPAITSYSCFKKQDVMPGHQASTPVFDGVAGMTELLNVLGLTVART